MYIHIYTCSLLTHIYEDGLWVTRHSQNKKFNVNKNVNIIIEWIYEYYIHLMLCFFFFLIKLWEVLFDQIILKMKKNI